MGLIWVNLGFFWPEVFQSKTFWTTLSENVRLILSEFRLIGTTFSWLCLLDHLCRLCLESLLLNSDQNLEFVFLTKISIFNSIVDFCTIFQFSIISPGFFWVNSRMLKIEIHMCQRIQKMYKRIKKWSNVMNILFRTFW